jgi:hypothetical protein
MSKIKDIEDRLDLIIDNMPIIRDQIEEIIDQDNIDYIDDFIEKTYSLEDFCQGLKISIFDIQKSNPNKLDYAIEVVNDDLYMLEKFSDFLIKTAEFIVKKENEK